MLINKCRIIILMSIACYLCNYLRVDFDNLLNDEVL
jgi:hypothetical protein